MKLADQVGAHPTPFLPEENEGEKEKGKEKDDFLLIFDKDALDCKKMCTIYLGGECICSQTSPQTSRPIC